MSRWARRRDECEAAIVAALRAAGATVQTLDATGVPDLLVGIGGRMYLLEAKDPDKGERNNRLNGKRPANDLGLRDSQADWWRKWKGPTPIVVTTPDEALAAIGVRRG